MIKEVRAEKGFVRIGDIISDASAPETTVTQGLTSAKRMEICDGHVWTKPKLVHHIPITVEARLHLKQFYTPQRQLNNLLTTL